VRGHSRPRTGRRRRNKEETLLKEEGGEEREATKQALAGEMRMFTLTPFDDLFYWAGPADLYEWNRPQHANFVTGKGNALYRYEWKVDLIESLSHGRVFRLAAAASPLHLPRALPPANRAYHLRLEVDRLARWTPQLA
jgi:hypothetical protein